jgi:hypothetical protein
MSLSPNQITGPNAVGLRPLRATRLVAAASRFYGRHPIAHMRTMAAIISGYVLWTALWLGGNAGLRAAGVLPGDVTQPVLAPMPLFGLLFLDLVCSLSGGCVAGAVARSPSLRTLALLGLLLFATGCFVQSAVWHLMPLWYHLAFLGILIPVTLLGGAVIRRRRSTG